MAVMVGSDAAFRHMLEEHFDAISRYCLRRLPVAEAHDAVSEVFLVAWRRSSMIPAGDETLLWLYGIARNVVRNAQRSARRRARLRVRLASEPRYPAQGPDVYIVRREEDESLIRALTRLAPDDQDVIRLRAYEGLTMREIAVVTGCSEEAAKKRVARALSRLRRQVEFRHPAPASSRSRAIQEGGDG